MIWTSKKGSLSVAPGLLRDCNGCCRRDVLAEVLLVVAVVEGDEAQPVRQKLVTETTKTRRLGKTRRAKSTDKSTPPLATGTGSQQKRLLASA